MDLDNYANAFIIPLPIRNTLDTAIKEIKPVIRKIMTPANIIGFLKFGSISRNFYPAMIKKMVEDYFKNPDIIISNVPGPREKYSINGKSCKGMACFATPMHNLSLFIVPYTFGGRLRFSMTSKDNLKMDPQEFFDLLNKNLNEDIQKH